MENLEDFKANILEQARDIVLQENKGVTLSEQEINEKTVQVLLTLLADVFTDLKLLKVAILQLLVRFRLMTKEGKQNPDFRQSMLFKGLTELVNMDEEEMQKQFSSLANLAPLIEKYNEL